MRPRLRAVLELLASVAAAAGAVSAWLAAGRTVTVPPVLDGEPSMTSVEYSAPLLGLALLLVTLAGVALVLAVVRLRRHAESPKQPRL